ncbi:MAG TPA: hypothetical protein VM884_02275 [Flavisolibacter sp.]|nr:hypothetical protein [Flavisolibacter sp.]
MASFNTQKLGAFFSNFATRYSPAIITMLVLAGGFYFYFYVVVSKNEEALKERNFRGLHRMANNIAGKISDYAERNADNFLTELAKLENQKSDSGAKALLKAEYELDKFVPQGSADTLQSFSVKFIDGWKLLFRVNKNMVAFSQHKDSIAYASAKKFVAPLLRRDIFPYYFLAAGDNILFDELNISHQSISKFLPGKYVDDTTRKNQIQSGEIREVTIGGKDYKLFRLPFIIRGNEEFTIGGYLPVETYTSQQRYIPTYGMLWLVIGVMLVLLMFPLLKIFLIQRSEQMLVSNAITSLASLHVIGAIVVLIAINCYVYFSLVLASANNNLKDIAKETAANFTSELDAALDEIDSIQKAVADQKLLTDSYIFPQNLRKMERAKDGSTAYPYFTEIPYTAILNLKEHSWADPHKGLRTTWTNGRYSLLKKPTPENVASGNPAPSPYRAGTRYPYFKHIAWTDTAGMQQVRWTTGIRIPQKINVSDRDYYKAIKNGDTWVRNGRPYYFTALSSWVSAEKLALISAPFADASVNQKRGLLMITLSGAFRSMFRALLPDGYGFCIVNENGDVLFHADENRSLNENLLDECTDNETMRSLLRTRAAGFASSSYSSNSQRFYVKPITGLPYSVVAYREMRTVWSEDLDVISACSILCLMNLAIILLAIIIIQASEYRHSLLHSQSILFTWLRPRLQLHDAYRSVSVFYWFSMMLQSLFFVFYNGSDPLCLVGISFSYSFFLLSYAYLQFAVLNESDEGKKRRNIKAVYLLATVYVASSLIFWLKLTSGAWAFIWAQLCLLFLAWLLAYKTSFIKGMMKQKNFRWWYVLFVFSFMAATSITPLLNFYFISFKEERLLSLKLNQLAFAGRMMREPVDTLAPNPDTVSFSYKAPFYFKNFADKVQRIKGDRDAEDTLENRFEALYKTIKPSFSDHSREIDFLIKAKDTSRKDFYWVQKPGADSIQFHYSMPVNQTYFDSSGVSMYSTLKSDIDNTGKTIKEDWLSFLLLISLLLLFLWGFNFLLNALVQKIFFEGFDNSTHFTESDVPFVKSLPAEENMFIIGPVNSGKFSMIKEYLKSKCSTFQVVDLIRLAKEQTKDILKTIEENKVDENNVGKCIVLLRHFELFMNDLEITEKKLDLLESLLGMKKQVIILSSRSFSSMRITEEKEGRIIKDCTDRWSNVMNQFYNLYHRWRQPKNEPVGLKMEAYEALLQTGRQRIDRTLNVRQLAIPELAGKMLKTMRRIARKREITPSESQQEKVIRHLEVQLSNFFIKLDLECGHSDFLWSIRPTLFTYIVEHQKEFLNFDFQNGRPAHLRRIMTRHFTVLFEQICLKIQSLSTNYYGAIWQSLSREEQRTLYDIALDDMVNPGNRDTATRLGDLGLVKRLPDIACYEVMNLSFRNFIFTQLGKREVATLRADADEKGSWNSFQLPVLLVVIAIGIFLFTTQKDAFTSLVTYLGAAAGGIAALLKVLSVIPSNKG